MINKRGLGKGMDALIPDFEMGLPDESPKILEISLHDIAPNRNQPRKHFDDFKLNKLVESIREKGIIQPIVVQKNCISYYI